MEEIETKGRIRNANRSENRQRRGDCTEQDRGRIQPLSIQKIANTLNVLFGKFVGAMYSIILFSFKDG